MPQGRPPDFKWPVRQCAGCGQPFSPTGSVQKFCRPSCTPAELRCYQCEEVKGRDEFYRKPDGSLCTPCKDCRRTYANKAWHGQTDEQAARAAERHWEQLLPRKFNITVEDYRRMCAEQDGRCKICRRSLEEIASARFKHFAVDHDRRCCPGDTSCGKCVRGLLCTKCNGSLGWYEQFPAEIAAYLAASVRR